MTARRDSARRKRANERITNSAARLADSMLPKFKGAKTKTKTKSQTVRQSGKVKRGKTVTSSRAYKRG